MRWVYIIGYKQVTKLSGAYTTTKVPARWTRRVWDTWQKIVAAALLCYRVSTPFAKPEGSRTARTGDGVATRRDRLMAVRNTERDIKDE